jgi:hypothetical protein
MRKILVNTGLALACTAACLGGGAGMATASPGGTGGSSQVATQQAEWVDMGHYGPGYEWLCHYHRDNYRIMGRPAECVGNGNGVTLWVWF